MRIKKLLPFILISMISTPLLSVPWYWAVTGLDLEHNSELRLEKTLSGPHLEERYPSKNRKSMVGFITKITPSGKTLSFSPSEIKDFDSEPSTKEDIQLLTIYYLNKKLMEFADDGTSFTITGYNHKDNTKISYKNVCAHLHQKQAITYLPTQGKEINRDDLFLTNALQDCIPDGEIPDERADYNIECRTQ